MNYQSFSATCVITNLQFNPDRQPHATLKAFNKFIEKYSIQYHWKMLLITNLKNGNDRIEIKSCQPTLLKNDMPGMDFKR